jgi:hypothetical protein
VADSLPSILPAKISIERQPKRRQQAEETIARFFSERLRVGYKQIQKHYIVDRWHFDSQHHHLLAGLFVFDCKGELSRVSQVLLFGRERAEFSDERLNV